MIVLFPISDLFGIGYGTVISGIEIQPEDLQENDYFGSSLAFQNNETLLVGSPFHQGTGAIYVYKYNSTIWINWSKIFPSSSSAIYFGYSLSLNNYNSLFAVSLYDQINSSSKGTIYIHIYINIFRI